MEGIKIYHQDGREKFVFDDLKLAEHLRQGWLKFPPGQEPEQKPRGRKNVKPV